MARISGNETKDFGIKSVFRGKIFDFFNKLRDAFPILVALFDTLKPEEPQEPAKPDTDTAPPKLSFDISVGEKFNLEEPIFVEATLTNVGKIAVRLSEMIFKVGTLDYLIRTPDGYELRFIGPVDSRYMEIWTLFPEESRSIDIDIKCGLFNVPKSVEGAHSEYEPYKFIPGVYAVRAVYKSFVPVPTCTSLVPSIWQGQLETEPPLFEIND